MGPIVLRSRLPFKGVPCPWRSREASPLTIETNLTNFPPALVLVAVVGVDCSVASHPGFDEKKTDQSDVLDVLVGFQGDVILPQETG